MAKASRHIPSDTNTHTQTHNLTPRYHRVAASRLRRLAWWHILNTGASPMMTGFVSYLKHEMKSSTLHTRFAHVWNEIVDAMREEDILSNTERSQVMTSA